MSEYEIIPCTPLMSHTRLSKAMRDGVRLFHNIYLCPDGTQVAGIAIMLPSLSMLARTREPAFGQRVGYRIVVKFKENASAKV